MEGEIPALFWHWQFILCPTALELPGERVLGSFTKSMWCKSSAYGAGLCRSFCLELHLQTKMWNLSAQHQSVQAACCISGCKISVILVLSSSYFLSLWSCSCGAFTDKGAFTILLRYCCLSVIMWFLFNLNLFSDWMLLCSVWDQEKIYWELIPFLSEIILHYRHKIQSLEPALGSGASYLFQDLGSCKWNGWIWHQNSLIHII